MEHSMTALPAPPVAEPARPEPPVRVSIVDSQLTFGRRVELCFIWSVAAIPAALCFGLLYAVVVGLLRTLTQAP
jgi:hypothetical protein